MYCKKYEAINYLFTIIESNRFGSRLEISCAVSNRVNVKTNPTPKLLEQITTANKTELEKIGKLLFS